ncbi:MAG: SPOR domain-containing protein [Polaromonas sp.]
MNTQRGGTLLGLIIGALVGLAIALTVAVYVTKVPIPFTTKVQPRPSESDAAEAQRNKDWNPNAPLAGKNPAKPAVPSASGELSPAPEPDAPPAIATPEPDSDSAASVPNPLGAAPERPAKPPKPPKPPAAPAPAPAPAPAVKTPAAPPATAKAVEPAAPAVVAKPAKPPSADPLGDLAKSRSQAPSSADPFNYFIQAGAFRTSEDAEQQRARLLLLGMQAKVTEREQAGRTIYRVRIGPFAQKDDADKVKDRLDSNSIETALVRVQR